MVPHVFLLNLVGYAFSLCRFLRQGTFLLSTKDTKIISENESTAIGSLKTIKNSDWIADCDAIAEKNNLRK